jgi:hypothetical protein
VAVPSVTGVEKPAEPTVTKLPTRTAPGGGPKSSAVAKRTNARGGRQISSQAAMKKAQSEAKPPKPVTEGQSSAEARDQPKRPRAIKHEPIVDDAYAALRKVGLDDQAELDRFRQQEQRAHAENPNYEQLLKHNQENPDAQACPCRNITHLEFL